MLESVGGFCPPFLVEYTKDLKLCIIYQIRCACLFVAVVYMQIGGSSFKFLGKGAI